MKHSAYSSGTSIVVWQLCHGALPWTAQGWLLKITLSSYLYMSCFTCTDSTWNGTGLCQCDYRMRKYWLRECPIKQGCGVTTRFNQVFVFKSMKQLIYNLLLWLQDLTTTIEGIKYWETPKCVTVRDIWKLSTIRRPCEQWLLYPRSAAVRFDLVCCCPGFTKTTRAWVGSKEAETYEIALDRIPVPAQSRLKQDYSGSQT